MTSSRKPLTVLFLPTYDGNPYQPSLWDALSSYDVDVIPGDHTDPLPISKHLLKDRPDVVHLHWMDSLVSSDNPFYAALLSLRLLFELMLCKLLGVRVVWTVHNYLGHEAERPKLELWLRRIVARSSETVMVHSEGVRSKIADGYDVPDDERSNVVAVDHGHFADAYENTMSREEARDSFDFEDDETVFLFFGNVKPYKGLDDLLSAFENFDEDEDARLLIAGRPPEDDGKERRLRERCEADDRIVTEFEFIPEDEIQRYMRAADAVALPFDRILTSGSAILAMSYENVVIAPEIGCLPDVLAQTDEFLYERGPDNLEATMRHALDADVEAAGRRNYERAKEFDWDAIAERTRRIYDGEDVPPEGNGTERGIVDGEASRR
ncbi:glycosyltransferase [Halorussus halophilus]|uniref:glycosyltransferase n=1 Tax=Halorussus halophilus TaxID=2650975 RepID=UPI001787E756|nr:glycosyltransferase [Halorussus halophilus]